MMESLEQLSLMELIFLGITPVDRNDFAIEFEPNGSETDSVEITSITRTDSNFLIWRRK